MEPAVKSERYRVLDPADRVTEVIFGLLMAMTFVGSLSVATAGHEEARTMLIAAFGCNLAWGLADAVIYLLRTWTDRTRNLTLLARLRGSSSAEEGNALIADALPPRIAAVAASDGLELLRTRLMTTTQPPPPSRLGVNDFKGALGTFLLVVLATFPLVVPFLMIERTSLAIRISNLVALCMLFACGWKLAQYSGGKPWASGAILTLVGTALMFAIIALGG